MRVLALFALAGAAALAAQPALAAITDAPARKSRSAPKVETFARGLVNPWGLAFLPDGRALVTERPGRMRLIAKDGSLSQPLGRVPQVLATRQGGLLDVAARPRLRLVQARLLLVLRAAQRRDQRHRRWHAQSW